MDKTIARRNFESGKVYSSPNERMKAAMVRLRFTEYSFRGSELILGLRPACSYQKITGERPKALCGDCEAENTHRNATNNSESLCRAFCPRIRRIMLLSKV